MVGKSTPLQNKTIFYLHLADPDTLKAVYMPYVRNGGLFIPTQDRLALGDKIFLLIRLFDEPHQIPLCATVAWITPANAQENKVQGIGIKFIDLGDGVIGKIENAMPEGKHNLIQSLTM